VQTRRLANPFKP